MSLLKRLEDLERALRFREPRCLVVTIPVDPVTGLTSAETDAAVAELHRQLGVTDDDLVVHIANYTDDPAQLPQISSATSQ